MKLERFHPSAKLAPFIKEFIIIESELETSNTIIPDTNLVMAFRYKGNVLNEAGTNPEALPGSVISGLRKSARILHYLQETANLLVVFQEGGISAFSRIPMHELFNRSISSDNIFPATELNEITDRLAAAKLHSSRIQIIETFLQKKVVRDKQDLLIGNAVQLIKQQDGLVKIRDLAAFLHISQDSFEKRFRATVGSTPKQFASIVRLRTMLAKYPSLSSLTAASYEAGYFDQSHFIKDFRLFTGQSPKEFFKSSRFW